MEYEIIILSMCILISAVIVSFTINRLRVTVRRSIMTVRNEYRSLRKILEHIDGSEQEPFNINGGRMP